MTPLSTTAKRRPGRPFGSRSRKTTLSVGGRAQTRSSAAESEDGPPLKRRRYVPGGRGGGGRFVERSEQWQVSPGRRATRGGREQQQSQRRSRRQPQKREQDEEVVQRKRTRRGDSEFLSPPPRPVLQPSAKPHQHPLPPPTPPAPVIPLIRPRSERVQSRGRITSASAAALALQQGDGYKPREERGWEEFHPELDIGAKIAVFTAEQVDDVAASRTAAVNGRDREGSEGTPPAQSQPSSDNGISSPAKRRPGRPPRRPDSMLNGILSPEQPKVVPALGPNPREKLTLPKPSFRIRDPFRRFEKGVGQQNYVDRSMASVGYQESDLFFRNERCYIRMTEGAQEDDMDLTVPAETEGDVNAAVGRVEYDMDEQDEKWLEDYNARRRVDQLEPIKPAIFEITMTKIEKEWHALEKRIPKPNPKPPQTHRLRSSSAAAVNGETAGPGEEQDSRCAVCDDGDCENSNAIVFCDGCDLAVHQECYGVPFIPEGQWLCRKCQLIGKGSINCIFCPNTEGAFKETPTSKWAHLLCAIWIPEVSIGNPALMEPITDVEKVPRSRWKLQCYICRQRMGASIQCSNKNCFVAFHVTCARRARLYLRMKSHGSSAIPESPLLKAFCDKHVPPDWRREHDTDTATAEAMDYYRTVFQGKQWGDSQAEALSLEPSSGMSAFGAPVAPRITLTLGGSGNKAKRIAPRPIWKLPSGAPVIPRVLLNSVAACLQRFTVRQRKQYAEDACKYWTLKREARRGAALLKRLQLQLETFSSMEMTRRDYSAMGPTGNKRLQHRIEFGDKLYADLDRLRALCDTVRKRELEKLKDAETLRSIVDIVYFPVPPLLWPIFNRACS